MQVNVNELVQDSEVSSCQWFWFYKIHTASLVTHENVCIKMLLLNGFKLQSYCIVCDRTISEGMGVACETNILLDWL